MRYSTIWCTVYDIYSSLHDHVLATIWLPHIKLLTQQTLRLTSHSLAITSPSLYAGLLICVPRSKEAGIVSTILSSDYSFHHISSAKGQHTFPRVYVEVTQKIARSTLF
jgi:hypothetical protein